MSRAPCRSKRTQPSSQTLSRLHAFVPPGAREQRHPFSLTLFREPQTHDGETYGGRLQKLPVAISRSLRTRRVALSRAAETGSHTDTTATSRSTGFVTVV